MPDFSFSPGPLLAYKPPEDGGHFITDYKWWLETGGNFALLGAGATFFQRGKTLAYSFKFRPGTTYTKWVLPFTITVQQPGLLHVAIDVAFYKGTGPAFEYISDQFKKLQEWIAAGDADSVKQAIGPAAFDELTKGGALTEVRVIFDTPPAWLTDP